MLTRTIVMLFGLTVPFAAIADDAQADKCAAGLTPESKLIYDKTSANLSPDVTLKMVIETETRELVHDGKVSMWSARKSAESAYPCLEMLQTQKSSG
jgi:hypothetical protein